MILFLDQSDPFQLLRAKLLLANVRYVLDYDDGRIDREQLDGAVQQAWRSMEATRDETV